MGTLSFDLICNRARGGARGGRGRAGPRVRAHLPRYRPPSPTTAGARRRNAASTLRLTRLGRSRRVAGTGPSEKKGACVMKAKTQDSCERKFEPDAESSVSHFVRSCTYYKSAREHARPVVSIRLFQARGVRRRKSSRVQSSRSLFPRRLRGTHSSQPTDARPASDRRTTHTRRR